MDAEAVIPCEFCDELITISQYIPHTQSCTNRLTPLLIIPLDVFHRFQNTLDVNEELRLHVLALRLQDVDFDDYESNLRLGELIGRVEVGLDNIDDVITESIEGIPSDDICVICQELLCSSERPKSVKLLCGHLFCCDCISKWLRLKKTCPTCMVDLEELLKKSVESVRKS